MYLPSFHDFINRILWTKFSKHEQSVECVVKSRLYQPDLIIIRNLSSFNGLEGRNDCYDGN